MMLTTGNKLRLYEIQQQLGAGTLAIVPELRA
jgi:hypothetical protein